MSQLTRRRVILAEIESSYGVDPTPTGAANAMLASEIEITPIAGESQDRGILYPELGASPGIRLNEHRMATFSVDLAGSGAADTAPAYGPILRACGLAETVTPTTGPVEYDPVSASFESVAIYAHADASLHAMLGCRGNLGLIFPGNGIPRARYTMTGLYVAAAAASLPTPDYSNFVVPTPTGKVNTPTFTLDSYACVVENFEVDLGNRVTHRDRIGANVVHIGERRATARLSIEAPALGTKNFFTLAEADTLMALQCIHVNSAGATVQVDAPKAQITDITYGDADGIQLLNMELLLTRDTGDDEVKLTVK